MFRQYFVTYGAPEEIVSDGGRQFESEEFDQFMIRWKVNHHITSSYNPHSNLLAESCVKNMKRLIRENTDRNGGLNTDAFVQALLTYRNTPTRGLGVSPAMVLFNRKLRDQIPGKPGDFKLRREWNEILDKREKALAKRHVVGQEVWSRSTKDLPVLNVGQHVLVQNQKGPHSKRWEMSGSIVEVQSNQTYLVRMDGSGRISRRHRQFLKAVKTYSPNDVKTQEYIDKNDDTKLKFNHNEATQSSHHDSSRTVKNDTNESREIRRSSRLLRGEGVNRAP